MKWEGRLVLVDWELVSEQFRLSKLR